MAERMQNATKNRDIKIDLKELYDIEMVERKKSNATKLETVKIYLKELYDIEMAEKKQSTATKLETVKIDLKELKKFIPCNIEMAERKQSTVINHETMKYDLKALYDIEINIISNPKTRRSIKIDGVVYKNLIREGYIHDRQRNVLLLIHGGALGNVSIMDSDIPDIAVEPLKPIHGGALGNVSITDSDVPDIGVESLKPTPYQTFKNAIIKKSARMADWLWKSMQNRIKN